MFDILPMLLSSVASFLFPIFASYKALKTSDPAQLTAWLMYWVVFSCCLLVENWVYFIVSWIPFYGYFRLLFLLYLILPQTQGARILYEDKVHPFLAEYETQIDEFIARAHGRLSAAGIAYLKLAIETIKTKVFGLPPSEPEPPAPEPTGPQGYTQSLLSRFSAPAAKWANAASANSGSDFYSLLSSAVAAATGSGAGPSGGTSDRSMGSASNLIPSHLRDSNDRMNFITTQRDRLSFLLTALDREAAEIQRNEGDSYRRAPPMAYDSNEDNNHSRHPSGGLNAWTGLPKSRSEADFEKIDAESGAEDEGNVRRRHGDGTPGSGYSAWSPFGWGGRGSGDFPPDARSSGMQR